MKIKLTKTCKNKIELIKILREEAVGPLSPRAAKDLADDLVAGLAVAWGSSIGYHMDRLGIIEWVEDREPRSYKAMLDRLDDLRLLLLVAMQAHPFSKSEGIRYRRALLDLKDIIPAARHWSVAYDRSRKAR